MKKILPLAIITGIGAQTFFNLGDVSGILPITGVN